MNSRFLAKTGSLLARWRARVFGPPALANVFRRDPAAHPRRALLSYLVRPFQVDPDRDPDFQIHSQWRQNLQIARLLDARGYRVDVVQFDDSRFVARVGYDLLVGLGGAAVRIAKSMDREALRIYINTGAESNFNNRQELDRIEALRLRRGCRVEPRRLTRMDPVDFGHFDALACFGNDWNASLYRPYHSRIHTFNNCGVPGIRFCEKDHHQARQGFLYLASHGQVHKGLDLLLEAFASLPDCRLEICTSLRHDRDFVRCYRHELFDLPNIRPRGWVTITSPQFHELCRHCSCAVSASCAEAGAGAMVDCMHAGLIPVISRECGIDTEDFGFTLASCEISELRQTIRRVADQPAGWHAACSRKAHETAQREYSAEAFDNRWREILDAVLAEGPQRRLSNRVVPGPTRAPS